MASPISDIPLPRQTTDAPWLRRGTLILVTVTVALVLHRRKTKQDDKEDAALDMELDGEFDDYPINQPRPTRSRQHRQPGQPEADAQMYRKPSVVQEDPNESRHEASR